MRIISQNGKVDLPYEFVAISTHNIHQEQVIAEPIANTAKICCVMGEYSTKEKAEKAMKMLRAEYVNFQETKSINGSYFAFNYPRVFRFPYDSGV
jgi:hypothetical protein